MNSKDFSFYKKNGYLVKKNLISKKTIQKINTEINKLKKIKKYNFFESTIVNKKKYLLRLQDPHLRNRLFLNLSKNKKIIDIVAKLMGGTARFHHSKLNFKLPHGGEAIEWHQDWAFYPHTNDDIVEVSIFLHNDHSGRGRNGCGRHRLRRNCPNDDVSGCNLYFFTNR